MIKIYRKFMKHSTIIFDIWGNSNDWAGTLVITGVKQMSKEIYKNIAESIIQSSTPDINLEKQFTVDNFTRGLDAFSLYNWIYLEIIAYEEDVSKQDQSATLLGAFNHHHLESQKILVNSIFQSFCGNYNIAYSLLRSFIECHMRGIFLNQLKWIFF